jgi:Fungal Zn(2)-Cys(6) binuclear cluster domain
MKTMDPNPISVKRKVRRREPKSCLRCRIRKTRCDKRVPCSQCLRSKGRNVCVYEVANSGTGKQTVSADESGTYQKEDEVISRAPLMLNDRYHEEGRTNERDVQGALNAIREMVKTSQFTMKRLETLESVISNWKADPTIPFPCPIHALLPVAQTERDYSSTVDKQLPESESLEAHTTDLFKVVPGVKGVFSKTKLFGPSHWTNCMFKVSVN